LSKFTNFFKEIFRKNNDLAPKGSYQVINGVITWNATDGEALVNEGYAGNDIVFSIINLITQKCKLADWDVYKIKDVKKFNQYKDLIKQPHLVKDWAKVQQLKEESIEVTDKYSRLTELLEYPNEDDCFSDLVEELCAYKLITGNSYLYSQMVEAGTNKGKPNALYSLPSQYVAIVAQTGSFPIKKVGYQLLRGTTINFTKEEVLQDKYFNPVWTINGTQLYGLSPLKAANKLLTRSNEAKTASVANFQNGGPQGIIFIDNDGGFNANDVQAQVDTIKETLLNFRGSRNSNKIATSGYKTGFVKTGLSPVDLGVLDAEKWDMRSLCNIYGVPSQLLNDPDNKIQANAREAERALTSRAALPLLTSLRDNLNRKLNSDWGYKGENIFIDFDLQAFPELQEDISNQVDYLSKAWWIPPAMKYEIMNQAIPDYLNKEELEMLYVPSGLMPLDELGQPIDLPKDLNPYAKD